MGRKVSLMASKSSRESTLDLVVFSRSSFPLYLSNAQIKQHYCRKQNNNIKSQLLAPLAPVMAQVFAALRDRSYLSLFQLQSQLRECRIFSRAPGLGNGGWWLDRVRDGWSVLVGRTLALINIFGVETTTGVGGETQQSAELTFIAHSDRDAATQPDLVLLSQCLSIITWNICKYLHLQTRWYNPNTRIRRIIFF